MKEEGSDAALRLELLGMPRWETTSGGAGVLKGKFALLVAYLALNGPQPRDTLAQMLWPPDLALAKDNLRQHVRRLLVATGHAVVDQGHTVRLRDGIHCDVHELPAAWPLQRLIDAGEFLAGIEIDASQRVLGWIVQQRRHWRGALADALCEHANRFRDEGRLNDAISLAGRAVALAPWRETAACLQMSMLSQRGDFASALDVHAGLAACLQTERQALPSAKAIALRRSIEAAAAAPPLLRDELPLSLLRPPQLIGRAVSWTTMHGAWAAGRPFLLRGEAGIGKSRLLGDFLRPLPGVLLVEARPGDEQSPYALFAALLRAVIVQHAVQPDAVLRRQLGAVLPEFAEAGNAVPVTQAALWHAAETLLLRAADSGFEVLAVDDLHFADLPSLETLRWLVAGSLRKRLHFAFATRVFERGARQAVIDAWLTDSQRPEPIDLGVWNPTDVAALLDSLGLDASVSAAALADHAGGHPFLTVETLKFKYLSQAQAHAHAQSRGLPQPASTVPLLELRLRSVPERAGPLLGLAAVLGADLDVELASAALGCHATETQLHFAALDAVGVMRGHRFVHELMRQAALVRLPDAERRKWHGVAAEALTRDALVPKARVAAHWLAAERWREAGAAFHAAGLAARDAGRLVEQDELLTQAAEAYASAGDAEGEFDALHDAIDSLMARLGPAGVRARLPRLQALAGTPERAARIAIANAEVLVNYYYDPSAFAAAEAALALALAHPALLASAYTVYGIALAQAGRFDAAVEAQRQAADSAAADPRQLRAVLSNTTYVFYEAGRIGDAITSTQESIHLAADAGDRAVAGQMQGNLATLLLLSGDPAAAVGPARAARACHSEIGSAPNSALAGMTLVTLGSALTFLGGFAEAIEVLGEAVRVMAAESPLAAQAKAQIALAHLWLLLGCGGRAVDSLAPDCAGWPPSLRLQWHWAHARAARLGGQPAGHHLHCMGAIQAEHWDAPLSKSAWPDWSRQGDAAKVAAQMRNVRPQYEAGGMSGTARTLLLREIDRLAEMDGEQANAAALATELHPQLALGKGLHPMTYLPEAWLILATAFERHGDRASAEDCRCAARHWIDKVALPNVPAAWRNSFLYCNPVNAALLMAR